MEMPNGRVPINVAARELRLSLGPTAPAIDLADVDRRTMSSSIAQ